MTTGSVASSSVGCLDIYEIDVKGNHSGGIDSASTRSSITQRDRKYPEDAYIEHGSHGGSEMSSIGLSSVEEQHQRSLQQAQFASAASLPKATTSSQIEELTRTAMISSQQRRAQRRQWNPSYHSSTIWSPPVPIQQPGTLVASSTSSTAAETNNFVPKPLFPPSPPDILEETKSSEALIVHSMDSPEGDIETAGGNSEDVIVAVGISNEDITPLNVSSTHHTTYNNNDTATAQLLQAQSESQVITLADTSPDDSDTSSIRGQAAAAAATTTSVHNSNFTLLAASDSKYEIYSCLVDRSQNDKSLEIHLYSLKRPHMRAFHLAWMSFFAAFFTWFSITPLLAEVQHSLNLTRKQIWTSSTYGVAGSAVTRILIGPICDKYGARWAMAGTLFVSAVPTGLTGLVQTAAGLDILRLVIGVAGSAFVTCQYWTSSMFTVEVAGTANALVAGWGNLGGGVTQIVMGSLLFPLFKIIYGGDSSNGDDADDDRASDLAWRTVCVIPAILCFMVSIFVVKYADDGPKGNYRKLHRQGLITEVSAVSNVRQAFSDLNTWILFLQYGCCFGVEITMVNGAALYFKEVFGQTTESAAAIASIFGWMNLFARGVGGFISDMINAKYGMRGRLWLQVITLILEGCFVILFGRIDNLGGAIAVMVVLSIFVQSAEGSTFGIVPYVQHSVTGSIAGVIGAGGNVGGVAFAIVFREYDYHEAFLWMGVIAMCSSLLSFCIIIRGHAGLLFGEDCPDVLKRRSDHNESFGTMPPLTTLENPQQTVTPVDYQDTSGHSSKAPSRQDSKISSDLECSVGPHSRT